MYNFNLSLHAKAAEIRAAGDAGNLFGISLQTLAPKFDIASPTELAKIQKLGDNFLAALRKIAVDDASPASHLSATPSAGGRPLMRATNSERLHGNEATKKLCCKLQGA